MYHLSVTYLNVSPVCVAAIKMQILICIAVFCWFHHVVLFYACYVALTEMLRIMTENSLNLRTVSLKIVIGVNQISPSN